MVPIERQILQLQRMTLPDLRERYRDLFGESTRSRHKHWLVKRIAWRVQVLAEGDLSERARQRAAVIADDADLRLTPPREGTGEPKAFGGQTIATSQSLPQTRDRRLPPAGTVLTRAYQGRTIRVTVAADGFEFDGEMFGSLSAVAKSVTGSHCNGFAFFKLGGKS
ncbi:DUF2924 domain-containing protein [Zavarzinella formosa]|uniref:DUF2924 domain-containing protein n=1 Tax=Zavarzinella formosa TaxID=360055 RepID=UPI0002E92569|nr:DUF2924 domain-containing protein [Zavarzinella formosa]